MKIDQGHISEGQVFVYRSLRSLPSLDLEQISLG